MVVSTRGTRIRYFRAMVAPLRMASGTSLALPTPAPTWPWRSPTTTMALKLKRRPPFTTFDTRLMATTRSVSSSWVGSIFSDCFVDVIMVSELQSRLAGGLGQGLYAPVVPIAPAVKNDLGYTLFLRPLADQGAHLGGHLCLGETIPTWANPFLQVRGGHQGPPRPVIDDLGVNVREAAEDAEAGPQGRGR